VPKIAPPVKRFMELKNPGELRINEVLELLRDYRRLAGALKDAGAFEKGSVLWEGGERRGHGVWCVLYLMNRRTRGLYNTLGLT
jgi:hypothetical protein